VQILLEGIIFTSYLTTIHVLLNELMIKALTKMQSFHLQQIPIGFMPFLKNVRCYAYRAMLLAFQNIIPPQK
jgi:hypothetical protein